MHICNCVNIRLCSNHIYNYKQFAISAKNLVFQSTTTAFGVCTLGMAVQNMYSTLSLRQNCEKIKVNSYDNKNVICTYTT